ncbi:MAG: DoxX family membrane protein [Candidatus Tectomicrobia bacterium]|uniref:DoxX family membrane protein n=1 Tax=Tectimicrobiota bacterium TaxID=2528274 RepID=A0A932GQV5_UNCTE|nr:DoxX family membrane protein [Candidatus Tectomicrobia bacterium]
MDPQSGVAPIVWLVLLRVAVGLIWLRSGLLKVVGGEYGNYREKLERFASKNPILWYREFMLEQLLPRSLPVGYLFVTAEVALGVMLTLGFLTVPAALIAIFMNVNFRLGCGWQNPSNAPFNYLMIACELLVIFSGAGNHLSLDALLFSAQAGG